MNAYIPFWKIKNNTNIIIYGCGKNGEKCYEQLIESGYCKLSLCVDLYKSGSYLKENKIENPVEIINKNFDYVFITILDEKVAETSRQMLVDLGVSEGKILTLYESDIIIENNIFENSKSLIQYINNNYLKYGSYAKRPEEIFPELSIYLLKCKQGNIIYVKELIESINLLDNNLKIIILILKYNCKNFDENCMKLYMSCLMAAVWKDDTLYGLVIDTTIMVFYYPQYIYKDFFIDRKKLQNKLCECYGLKKLIQEQEIKKETNKIVIVTSRFRPNCITDAPSILVKNYALAYAKLGYTVKILVLYSSSDDDIENVSLLRIYGCSSNTLVDYSIEDFENYDISIDDNYISNINERLIGNVNTIIEFAPEYIIDMSDEMFIESIYLKDSIPVVNFPMRGNAYSSEASIYFVDSYNRVSKDMLLYNSIEMKNVRELVLGNVVIDNEDALAYSKEDYELNGKFILVTVGTRLNYEISYELIEYVGRELLEKYNMVWILVGDVIQKKNSYFYSLLQQRKIIEWGYEKNLFRLFKMCDLYLNPKRIGGGMSIKMCMYAGKPIAMVGTESDAYIYMHKDYIINNCIDDMMKYIIELYKNPELYKKISDKTRKQIEGYTIESDAKKIIEICENER